MLKHLVLILIPLLATMTASSAGAGDVRIKDITTVEGVRVNKTVGIGLVTGLNGTGGKSPITRQFALNFLQRFGQRADPQQRLQIQNDAKQKTDNLSVVTVTAEIPVFAKRGSRVDVTVSAFDDATSLEGGTLLTTPLFGIDDRVYVLASGAVSIGGFSASGQAASVQKNHPTTGRVPNGGTVEEEVPQPLIGFNGRVRFLLKNADYETARRIIKVINEQLLPSASIVDAGTVEVQIPPLLQQDVAAFIGMIEGLRVNPDNRAKVVINERTGTVIIGEHVRLDTVAITHGSLSVINAELPQVSQPAPFSRGGETTVVPRTQLDVVEEKKPLFLLERPSTVGDLARALNVLGVTARDLSAIFQQLKEAGALHADLEFR